MILSVFFKAWSCCSTFKFKVLIYQFLLFILLVFIKLMDHCQSNLRSYSNLSTLDMVYSLVDYLFLENFQLNFTFFSCTFARIYSFFMWACSREKAFQFYSSRISTIFLSQVEKPIPCSCNLYVRVESLSPKGKFPSQAQLIKAASISFQRSISVFVQSTGSSSALQTSTLTELEKSKGTTNFYSTTFSSKSVNFCEPVSRVSSQTSWQK